MRLFLSVLLCMFLAAHARAQFTSVTPLNAVPITSDTKDKPQSKVWTYNGKHWAVLVNSNGTYVMRLDGTSWTNVLKLSSSTSGRADCKKVGNVTHVLVFRGTASKFYSIEYVPATNTYKLWSVRSSEISVSLDNGVETASIDIDGTGRMWLASDEVEKINVRYSDYPYSSWSAPVTIATGISSDDICGVIALPTQNKIGVFWSNQVTRLFGFKTHENGASPATWSADEKPASQSALKVGYGMADDHMHLTVGLDGTLYCAAKTSYDKAGYPKLILLVRRPAGTWDNLYKVSESGTRAIVILNEALGKLKVIYTESESGGKIFYKESSTSAISFGTERTLISGTNNFVSSMKENYTSEVVVLATGNSAAVGILGKDGSSTPAPAAPTLSAPADLATNVAIPTIFSWNAVQGAETYELQVSLNSAFSGTPTDQNNLTTTTTQVSGLQGNTVYYWRVRAAKGGGASEWSAVWSFTTQATAPPPSGSLAGYWKMDEGRGTRLNDFSGLGNHATTAQTTSWENGVSGLALKFNGTSQFASVPNNSTLNITEAITLAAWVKPAKVTTQYILAKEQYDQTDGYELTLSSDQKVYFRISQASSGSNFKVTSNRSYPMDGATWMHIAATFDGTVVKIYINGVEDVSRTLSAPVTIKSNSLPLTIGAQSDGTKRFQGSMDEARLYSRALSTSEISDLVNNSAVNVSLSVAKVQASISSLQVYPNPVIAASTVRFVLPAGGNYEVQAINATTGKATTLKQGTAIAGQENTVLLEAEKLNWGTNIIRLQTKLGVETIRLLRDSKR